MLDNLATLFLKEPTEINAVSILRYARINNMYHICDILGEYMVSLFLNSDDVKDEYAVNTYYTKNYEKSYELFEDILKSKSLSETKSSCFLFNQHFSIEHIADRYIHYNIDKVNQIMQKTPSDLKLITLSITTCKRFDLFEKTINSVLNCFDIEMIDEWLCVDDNSSEEDRDKMKKLYPFFTFIWKDVTNKGHPRSMNIIRNTVKTPFLFQLEDDWKFFSKRDYIKDAMTVLESDEKIGQCLVNKNYTETHNDISIKGGLFKTTNDGFRYYIHEYVRTDEQKFEWFKKYGNCLSSNYWPHFSFRPSLIRTSVFNEIGEYNENVGHFEMEYAHRYHDKNYISAFFEGIYSIHTGRLTSEKHDVTKQNAYTLNNEQQFVKKSLSPVQETSETDLQDLGINMKTYVLNLDRRPDRWDKFKMNAKNISFLNYQRFSAIDGRNMKSSRQLQRIFDGNDYNMQVGAVGCAMSYFKMYTELIYSDYDTFLFLEDDAEFAPNFENKFIHMYKQLENTEWDVLFLGHHIRNVNDPDYKKDMVPTIEKWDVYKSFLNSLGGTIGYMISKSGAKKVLDFINENKLVNCIDTALQKTSNVLNVYYCTPHIVFGECVRMNSVNKIDTDIQNIHDSLTISLDEKIKNEIDFYRENDTEIEKFENIELCLEKLSSGYIEGYYIGTDQDVEILTRFCSSKNIKHYTFDNKVIFFFNTDKYVKGYFHIFKNGDKYSVDDCL